MEKNKELILKYLADLMTENEKCIFENELKANYELKNEYEKFIDLITVEKKIVSDSYFINLLPNIKIKQAEKKKSYKRQIAFGVPSFVATIILVFVLFNKKSINNSNEIYSQLNEPTMITEYVFELDEETQQKYYDIILSENISSIDLQNEEEKEKLITIYDSILDNEILDLALNDSKYNKLINELQIKN